MKNVTLSRAMVTISGILAAFAPAADVTNVVVFELKMAAGVGLPIAIGFWLYWRARAAESRIASRL